MISSLYVERIEALTDGQKGSVAIKRKPPMGTDHYLCRMACKAPLCVDDEVTPMLSVKVDPASSAGE